MHSQWPKFKTGGLLIELHTSGNSRWSNPWGPTLVLSARRLNRLLTFFREWQENDPIRSLRLGALVVTTFAKGVVIHRQSDNPDAGVKIYKGDVQPVVEFLGSLNREHDAGEHQTLLTSDEHHPASFWLCIAVWVIIGLAINVPAIRDFSYDNLQWWAIPLVIPFALGGGLFLLFFSIAGNAIPAEFLERVMRRSRYERVRRHADNAVLIWLVIIAVFLSACCS